MQLEKPQKRPLMVTICGDAGMGKTTLAATFPKPVFIRAEDGMQSIPDEMMPDAFPTLTDEDMIWGQIAALLREPHDYRTLVIDSVSSLERLFIQGILDKDETSKGKKPASINQALGGYGAGYAALAAMHQRVRKGAGLLNERRKMHVVFLAHADTETLRLPDTDDYMRYCLRLNDKSVPPYVDDVDVVGFLRLETFVMGDDSERKKAVSTGSRQLICHATAANISKNRLDIESPLECVKGENPLAPWVKEFKLPVIVKTEEKGEEQ